MSVHAAITSQAVILVGGRGTRLGALTDDTPKPLLAVGGKPFLAYVVGALARQGFRDIVLLAGYQAAAVQAFARDHAPPGVQIQCVVEASPLGTGGALRNAAPWLADEAWLYVESPAAAGIEPGAGFGLHREGRTREARYALYRRVTLPQDPSEPGVRRE